MPSGSGGKNQGWGAGATPGHAAGDAEFAPSGSEAEDESEEEGSSDQESLASEGGSSDAAEGSEDEDEESGMSWDELEKEAERCEIQSSDNIAAWTMGRIHNGNVLHDGRSVLT